MSSLNHFFCSVGKIFFPTLNHYFPSDLKWIFFKPEEKSEEEKGALSLSQALFYLRDKTVKESLWGRHSTESIRRE